MADGFTLDINEKLARDIERRAAEAGISREDYARQLLALDRVGPDADVDDLEWDEPGIPWEDVKAWIESWGTPHELPKPR